MPREAPGGKRLRNNLRNALLGALLGFPSDVFRNVCMFWQFFVNYCFDPGRLDSGKHSLFFIVFIVLFDLG